MTVKKLCILLFFFLFTYSYFPAFAQVVDSVDYKGRAGVMDVADEDPGLFIVMMFMLVGAILVFFLLFVFSALLALAAFLSSAVFIGAGIFTTSAFIGWYNKSFSEGFKWLCMLIFGFFGLGAGAFVCWLLSWIWPIYFTFSEIIYWGLGIGAVSGGASGWVVYKMIRLVLDFVKRKYQSSSN